MAKKNVTLIGLGPHAKRIYLNYFKKHKVNLALVVDLESEEKKVREYLQQNGFKNTKVFTIPDKYKDDKHLPKRLSDNLYAVCKTLEITHIFISTEPKAHYQYLEFALKNNINVLTDKPITVNKNMTNARNISETRKQYYEILKMAENSSAMCKVMCQRQYHKGYEYIKKMLGDTVKKYNIPITYIDICHCDGNWEMPHDLEKENHPYKYGYGKLFHSGYHFIDLLSDLIKINNNNLIGRKRITKGEVRSDCFTPNDEMAVFNIEDYKRIFAKQNIPEYYYQNSNPKFNKYGEKNYYGSLEFKNSHNQLITYANLNLLHYGFSRRGWINSKDYYKSNGRIRHESINIQIGTLMNVQVHSYQSKEIKDRLDCDSEEQVGGLEHFDIDIYRNTDIIGGKPFERIKLGDLYSEKEKKDILGYNELSREVYISNFLKGKCKKGDIRDQALAIEILYSCALGIKNHYEHKDQTEKINVTGKYVDPVNIQKLKKYSYTEGIDDNKTNINYCPIEKDNLEYIIVTNYLIDKNEFEVYLCIRNQKVTASALLYKTFKSRLYASLYYYLLSKIVKYNDIKGISKILEFLNKQ